LKKATLLFLVWLVLINIFAFLVANRFNLKPDTAYRWIKPSGTPIEQSWNPVSFHARWDSIWLNEIAKDGYHLQSKKDLSNIVFFPLYPIFVRVATLFTGGNQILAGWLLSIAFSFGAVAIFYRLLREFHPSIDPQQPILYLLIFPTAFFLNAVYTESLFLFLSLLTFYYTLKGRFGLAGVFGLLAALTRVPGLVLFIPVVWEYWQRHGRSALLRTSFLPVFLIPLGTILFFLYHYFAFGDFFLFLKIEKVFGRGFGFTKEHFSLFSHPAVVNFILDIAFVAFICFCAYLVFSNGWISYGLYIVASVAMALNTGTLLSIGRFILVLFPIYIALATIRNREFEKLYIVSSSLLLALNITLFVNWYWAG
jgi:hypothetical protein